MSFKNFETDKFFRAEQGVGKPKNTGKARNQIH
jgi:hypothetical protein